MKCKFSVFCQSVHASLVDIYRRLTMERVSFYEREGPSYRNYDTWVPRRLWDGHEFQNGVIIAMESAGLHIGWKDEGRDNGPAYLLLDLLFFRIGFGDLGLMRKPPAKSRKRR